MLGSQGGVDRSHVHYAGVKEPGNGVDMSNADDGDNTSQNLSLLSFYAFLSLGGATYEEGGSLDSQ